MSGEPRDVELAVFDSMDFELRWPGRLVKHELLALTGPPHSRTRMDSIGFMLEEAFVGEFAAQEFAARKPPQHDDPWGTSMPSGTESQESYLERLVKALPSLPEHREPAPYWPDRRDSARGGAAVVAATRQRFAGIVRDLRGRGYFGADLPPECEDDYEPVDGSVVLLERLGIEGLWPLRPQDWDEDTFYGLIEVFHDLAKRPRVREWHSHNGCGWHYSSFSPAAGRMLYRWRINRLLTSAAIPLHLAETGEDTGRLVRDVDDGRADLLQRVVNDAAGDRVAHAIAQFRSRTATEHDKRSAVITLAGVLEERRETISTNIGKKDEGVLFGIANSFAIRHQRRGQHGDYDPDFLDWIFWTYLATVELTGHLQARNAQTTDRRE